MKLPLSHRCFLFGFLVLGLFSRLPAQQTRSTPVPPPAVRLEKLGTVNVYGGETPEGLTAAQKVRWDSFVKVWDTLNQNYFDRTFNGLDWNKIKSEYRPRIVAAQSDGEVNRVLDEMIQRLGRSHFAIIPNDVFRTVEAAKREAKKRGRQLSAQTKPADVLTEGKETDTDDVDFFDEDAEFGIGVELRMLGGQFVVTYVDPKSAAQLAGIKRGYIVDKINGVSVSDMVRRITFSYPNVNHLNRYLPIQIVSWFLDGEKDSKVTVTCLDENDQAKDFRMERMRLAGSAVSIGNNYPPQFLDFRTRSIDADTGYIKFNLFTLDVVEKFCSALTEFKDKKALVLDLRGNLGGILGVLSGVAGMLTDHTVNLGTSIYRRGSEPLDVKARAKHFSGRLVMLVDNQSVSAAEMFASGMRENDRVLIVGTTTAGEALPAISIELPTGAVFMYPIANFKSKNGKSIEGAGVEPDYKVTLDRQTLLKDVDAPLDKALSLIHENTAFPQPKVANTGMIGLSVDGPPPPPKPTPKPIIAGKGDGPPPPLKLSAISGGGLSAYPPKNVSEINDVRSLQIIDTFLKAVNISEIKNIRSYAAIGTGHVGARGSSSAVSFAGYRQFPDKFAFTIDLGFAGELREVHNGPVGFLESDIGLQKDLPPPPNAASADLFGPITTLSDLNNFKSLKFLGDFERDGRKCHVIEGKYGSFPVALLFDIETKMLVSFGTLGAPVSFGDYRKVGAVMLPFHIALERNYDIDMTDIKINISVDESHFKKKENCFDKPL